MSGEHVAVLMGGFSAERPVSLSSGSACAAALRDEGYRVTEVDVDRNIAARLVELRPDVAFNALHGPYGEDGCIQGILEYLNIPYTHSGVAASSIAMDKALAKTMAAAAGIPLAEHLLIAREEAGRGHPMAPPYVVKPVDDGSSFGVFIVRDDHAHPPQELLSSDWPFGEQVMVERYVPGRELTCAVMGEEALGVIEILTPGGAFYDYDAKYAHGGSQHVLPAEIKPNLYQEIRNLSLKAHRSIGCRGVSRSDFRMDEKSDGSTEIVWLEVNTQPGMTPTSLVPELAAHAGRDFGALVRWLVEDASCRR